MKQYGLLPEFYNVAQGGSSNKRDGYPLRPELIESAMYLYRDTKDPFLLALGIVVRRFRDPRVSTLALVGLIAFL